MRATQLTSPRAKTTDKRFSLMDSERRFKRACEQIVQLNYKMSDLQSRYSTAKKENHRSFRYSLRLRLAVVEGLRNMYYDYAHNKAQTVANRWEKRCTSSPTTCQTPDQMRSTEKGWFFEGWLNLTC